MGDAVADSMREAPPTTRAPCAARVPERPARVTLQRLAPSRDPRGGAGATRAGVCPPSRIPATPARALEAVRAAPGATLHGDVRAGMEALLGADLSSVRIHTGAAVEREAAALDARAFTVGEDVALGPGAFDPTTPAGRETLAHELTHVLQQRAGPVSGTDAGGGVAVSEPGDPFEREAAAVGRRVAAAPPPVAARAGATVPRPPAATGIRGAARTVVQRQQPPSPGYTPAPPQPQPQPHQDLHAQFQQQMGGAGGSPPDFDAAALTLNGMSQSDMDAELGAVSPPLRVGLFKGAMRQMLLWPPPNRVADAIYRIDGPSARQGRIEYLAEVVAASDWRRAALTLNGFNDPDILAQLTPLTPAQRNSIRDAANQYMSGWGSRVVGPIHDLQQQAVSAQMGGMVGQSATWHGSGQTSGTTFQQWASAASEAAAPPVQPATVINCWEMVLLAAYNAGVTPWSWIHGIYTASAATTGGDWGTYLANQLTPSGRQAYVRGNPAAPSPARGDIVLFNGVAHVALATGTRDGTGRSQVWSFWPPPNTPFTRGGRGTVDSVKVTTIEELADYIDVNLGMGAPTLEFGPGPW